jgi:cytochrome b561
MAPTSYRASGYDRVAVALHWLIALAIVGQVLLGWYVHEIPRGTPARGWWINLHKSVGLSVGLFIVVRLGWRVLHGAPSPSAAMPRWQVLAASVSHKLLYACMLALPLTGYLASNFSKHGIKFFNLVLLPPWGADDKTLYAALNGAHVALTWVLLAVVGLHVLAAIVHLVRRDGVFGRMLPEGVRAA